MKIKPEHFEQMKKTILANSRAPTWPTYRNAGLSEKRWRWDIARQSGLIPFLCETIYPYANDDHFDTALRKILHCDN